MTETNWSRGTKLERAVDLLLSSGHMLFSIAIIALGVETFVCAGSLVGTLIQSDRFGVLLGPALTICGVGLLFKRTMRAAAMAVGSLLFLYALIFEAPRYAAALDNMTFRTQLFEPIAIATVAWLLPGRETIPSWLGRASRYLLSVSFIVFGVDHFLALAPIGTLIPPWIPWHVFWIAFFGAAFIAAALSLAFDILPRWSAASIGLMLALWVLTLHLPRVLFGLYGGHGPRNPDEWSSLFIAIALWGGSWALASNVQVETGRNALRSSSQQMPC
jgi:uncharacterized membrane protein